MKTTGRRRRTWIERATVRWSEGVVQSERINERGCLFTRRKDESQFRRTSVQRRFFRRRDSREREKDRSM